MSFLHKYLIRKTLNMKDLVVIFDRPVILPVKNKEPITTYGLSLDKTDKVTIKNLKTYIIYYIEVLSLIFKDEEVKICNQTSFKKNGMSFVIDSNVWDKYAIEARKTCPNFAIILGDDIEIKDDDLYETLLTNKEKWEVLKGQKDIIWYK